MNIHLQDEAQRGEAQGQATFGMSNLRPQTTGLPFIVFISQKNDARHDARVNVSPAPKVRLDQMSSYALRPFRRVEGEGLGSADEAMLGAWAAKNLDVLVSYWNGDIAFTEDAIERLVRL